MLRGWRKPHRQIVVQENALSCVFAIDRRRPKLDVTRWFRRHLVVICGMLVTRDVALNRPCGALFRHMASLKLEPGKGVLIAAKILLHELIYG